MADFRRSPRTRVNFEQIAAVALVHAEPLLRRWLPGGALRGREYVALNPKRADRRPGSFKVNVNSGRWMDFAIGASGGDLISLAAYLFAIGQAEAAKRIANMLSVRHD